VVVASQLYASAVRLLTPQFGSGVVEARPSDAWISLIRVVVLLTLIPASWFGIIPIAHPDIPPIVLALGGYVILLTVGPRHLMVLRKADLIIVLDILMIALVIGISGDLASPFRYLYYLVILEAAARMNLRHALAASVAVAAVVVLLWARAGQGALLETTGFQVGAFIASGFLLALFLGTLIEEHRTAVDVAQAYDTTLEGWSHALDLRDKETEGHTRRVTEMTLRLARAMDIADADLVHIRRGALLHDIGKMAIPDTILFKPGPLSDEEWAIMRRHPVYAYELLAPIAYLRPALDIPYCHHEKWDGTGYPRGLQGMEIPLPARIFALADVWDALLSDRPYGSARTVAEARLYICDQAGKHFDPQVAEVFLQIVKESDDASAATRGIQEDMTESMPA
jgi:putative nucleotidyltransferase with HDIG domain